MAIAHAVARFLVGLALTTGLAGAQAQTLYRCTNGTSSYLSDRPCDNGVRSRITMYGPSERSPGRRDGMPSSVGKAEPHLAYMSVACADMSEGIRTGSARGLKSGALRELQDDYRRRCSEDEQNARRMLSQDEQRLRDEKRARVDADTRERKRTADTRDQCHEMLRILHQRRQRAEQLDAGQRADLARAEATYRERCSAG